MRAVFPFFDVPLHKEDFIVGVLFQTPKIPTFFTSVVLAFEPSDFALRMGRFHVCTVYNPVYMESAVSSGKKTCQEKSNRRKWLEQYLLFQKIV